MQYYQQPQFYGHYPGYQNYYQQAPGGYGYYQADDDYSVTETDISDAEPVNAGR